MLVKMIRLLKFLTTVVVLFPLLVTDVVSAEEIDLPSGLETEQKLDWLAHQLSENLANGNAFAGQKYLEPFLKLVIEEFGKQDAMYATAYFWKAYYEINVGERSKALKYIVTAIEQIELARTFHGTPINDTKVMNDFSNWRNHSRGAALGLFAGMRSGQGFHQQSLNIRRRIISLLKANKAESPYEWGTAYYNLGSDLRSVGQFKDALKNFEKAARIFSDIFEPGSALVVATQIEKAATHMQLRQFDKAHDEYTTTYINSLFGIGPTHLISNVAMLGLSTVYNRNGDYERAEGNLASVLDSFLQLLPPEAEFVQRATTELTFARQKLGKFELALETIEGGYSTAVSALRLRQQPGNALNRLSTLTPSLPVSNPTGASSSVFEAYIHILSKADEHGLMSRKKVVENSLEAVQWMNDSPPAVAISQMATRFDTKSADLVQLIRQRQDILRQLVQLHTSKQSIVANKVSNTNDIESTQEAISKLEKDVDSIESKLRERSPDFFEQGVSSVAELDSLQGTASETHNMSLQDDEVLLVLQPIEEFGDIKEGIASWLITKNHAKFRLDPVPLEQLNSAIFGMRCGLDWALWQEIESESKCLAALDITETPKSKYPPFNRALSRQVYDTLIRNHADSIRNKRLIIVPYGWLGSTPFNALIAESKKSSGPYSTDFSNLKWFGIKQDFRILPAVQSLIALRSERRKSSQKLNYLGYADPVLQGRGRRCSNTKIPAGCEFNVSKTARLVRGTPLLEGNKFDKAVDARRLAEEVLSLCPLPDSRMEVECAARSPGITNSQIRIGAATTEVDLKQRDDLSQFQVIHFATHGLLGGSIANPKNGVREPALVFTPPKMAKGSNDGLLFSSEILELKLDAELVILSACSTASGIDQNAAPLTGLTQAFLYAGSRTIMVSHWPVNSEVATFINIELFKAHGNEQEPTWSGSLRRAMETLIVDELGETNAHPAIWGPFFIVGGVSI